MQNYTTIKSTKDYKKSVHKECYLLCNWKILYTEYSILLLRFSHCFTLHGNIRQKLFKIGFQKESCPQNTKC